MNSTPKNDQVMEAIFSLLRWFFLFVAAWIYYGYYDSSDTRGLFLVLFCVGTTYMGATQFVLFKGQTNSNLYYYVTRAGIIFDLLALVCLMALTGLAGSPMLPIGFLIIMHASVYWDLKGGIITSCAIASAYSIFLLSGTNLLPQRSVPFITMNYVHLLFIGLLGGLIVARERKHLGEKSQFEMMAKRDYLTGLWNHRTFQERLKEYMDDRGPLTVVMADIDEFKSINDRYGHVIGDRVLKELAYTLDLSIPKSYGTAYRYGGEEFSILIHTTDGDDVRNLLEGFRRSLKSQMFEAGNKQLFCVTMSFGVAVHVQQTATDLLQEADAALYEAKRTGRDRIVWSRPQ